MEIDYIFPDRIFSSKKSDCAKILNESKMTLKFIAPINIKFLKCSRFFSWLLKTQKPSIAIFVFYKDLATSFNALIKQNGVALFLKNIIPAEEKKEK